MVGQFWGYARDMTHGIIKDHMGLAWFGKKLDFYPCSYSNSMKNMMMLSKNKIPPQILVVTM